MRHAADALALVNALPHHPAAIPASLWLEKP
jgi:hypothetical protein